jgi:hypothetical protein
VGFRILDEKFLTEERHLADVGKFVLDKRPALW